MLLRHSTAYRNGISTPLKLINNFPRKQSHCNLQIHRSCSRILIHFSATHHLSKKIDTRRVLTSLTFDSRSFWTCVTAFSCNRYVRICREWPLFFLHGKSALGILKLTLSSVNDTFILYSNGDSARNRLFNLIMSRWKNLQSRIDEMTSKKIEVRIVTWMRLLDLQITEWVCFPFKLDKWLKVIFKLRD